MLQLIKELDKDYGALLLERFKQEVMPNLVRGPKWEQELTEEEYQLQLTKLRSEIPAILQFLQAQSFKAPPSSWTAKQN